MKQIISQIKENKIPFIITVIQWFITTIFQIDKLFFNYDAGSRYMLVIAIKLLYLIFLLIVWCFGFNVYKKIEMGNEQYKRGIRIFGFYLIIMVTFLLILWPGTWSWDDLNVLLGVSNYKSLGAWQHIMTGTYQDVMLQILPFPGGFILIQNTIISLCVAFCVVKLETVFGIKKIRYWLLDLFVKVIPFLLPPVLMYQFSGYRMGLYVYLELVMLVMLICAVKDKEEWSMPYFLLFIFLCIVISSWRTESFVYVPCICLLILFISRNIIPNKKKAACILIFIIGFIGVSKVQNLALGNSNYEVVSLLRPCAELVKAADPVGDADLLAEINRVASLDVIYDNPSVDGTALYWDYDVVHGDYTREDYKSFLKAFINLSLRYPEVVIAERWNLFITGSGITGKSYSNVELTVKLFDEENENSTAGKVLRKGWIAYSPVFKGLRKTFINMLGMRRKDGSYVSWIQKLIWNLMIPLTILVCAWIRLLIKKQWYLFGVCTAVLIRVPIVILTQPDGWFMYMLSFYFLGYVCLVYGLLIFWSRRKYVEGE